MYGPVLEIASAYLTSNDRCRQVRIHENLLVTTTSDHSRSGCDL